MFTEMGKNPDMGNISEVNGLIDCYRIAFCLFIAMHWNGCCNDTRLFNQTIQSSGSHSPVRCVSDHLC